MDPSFEKLHSKYLSAFFEASKLFPDSFFSIVPTVLFLVALFALLFVQFRCHSHAFAGWKTKICWVSAAAYLLQLPLQPKLLQDVIFHWLLFYISRVWFIFLSLCKLGLKYLDSTIKVESAGVPHQTSSSFLQGRSAGPEVHFNTLICHCSVFLLVLTVSLLPCLVLYLRYYSQREMPNFLMWQGPRALETSWILTISI